MPVGIQPTRGDIDNRAGAVALALHRAVRDAREFKLWLDTQTDADLTLLNFTAGEIAVLRSAVNDLNQLATIYAGATNLGVAKDFRTFTKQLYGFGL